MRRASLLCASVAILAILSTGGVAAADPNNNNSEKLRAAVTSAGILQHQGALQGISDALGGNRLAGAPGHEGVGPVRRRQGGRGRAERVVAPLQLRPRLPRRLHAAGALAAGGERPRARGSPARRSAATSARCTTRGRPTSRAPIWAVDLNLDPAAPVNSNTSGCQASDYNGMPDGAIALVQRGTCTFAMKFRLARAVGRRRHGPVRTRASRAAPCRCGST